MFLKEPERLIAVENSSISCTSIGNDIVDLRLDEPDLHPRYIARVFTEAEQLILARAGLLSATTPASILLRHELWAAKESCYKALKRQLPKVIFSPRLFEVDFDRKLVKYDSLEITYQVIRTDELLATHCQMPPREDQQDQSQTWHWIAEAAEIQTRLARESGDQSGAVRAFAVERCSELLGVPSERLAIGTLKGDPRLSRIPTLLIDNQPSPHLLSLAHHGRFVAVACRL